MRCFAGPMEVLARFGSWPRAKPSTKQDFEINECLLNLVLNLVAFPPRFRKDAIPDPFDKRV